jgi:hypothetical protein
MTLAERLLKGRNYPHVLKSYLPLLLKDSPVVLSLHRTSSRHRGPHRLYLQIRDATGQYPYILAALYFDVYPHNHEIFHRMIHYAGDRYFTPDHLNWIIHRLNTRVPTRYASFDKFYASL